MKLIAAAMIVLSLSGCAGGFSKPGGTYQGYLGDRFECLKISSGAYCANEGLFVSCMAQRGWKEDSNGFKPPQGAAARMC